MEHHDFPSRASCPAFTARGLNLNWAICLIGSALIVIVLVILGFAISLLSGSRLSFFLSDCVALGLFSFIGSTLISPAIHFGIVPIVFAAVVVVLILRAVGSIGANRNVSASAKVSYAWRDFVPLFAGLAVNFCFLLLVFSCSGLTPDHLIQQYDNPFHFSVVQHILDTGNASPLGAGSVMGNSTAIYPDVWHALCALLVSLFGLDIQMAGWIVVLAFVGFIAPIGFHDLYLRIQRNPSRCGEVLSVVLPVVLPLSALEFTYRGSLYANVVGLCVLPAALVMVLDSLDRDASLTIPVRVAGCLIAFGVVGFCHPNTVFVLGIFCLLYLIRLLPSIISKLFGFIGALALWVACCFVPLFSRTINCADRIGPGMEKGLAVFSKLHLDYSFLVSHEWILWVVLAGCVACVVAASFWARIKSNSLPYAMSIFVFIALFFVALFPQTLLAKYAVGFWYRDFKRLLVTALFMGSLLVPLILDKVLACISKHFDRHGSFQSAFHIAVSAAMILIVGLAGFRYYRTCLSPEGDCVNGVGYAQMTDEDRSFFAKASKVVGDDVVLNNYNDSSVWLYSLYHVNALIKGRPANQISSMSDDLYTAVRGIAQAGYSTPEGGKVRGSLRKLKVRYYLQFEGLQNTTTKFMPNGQIDYQSAGENSVVTDETPGFDKVLTDGRYTLYKVL